MTRRAYTPDLTDDGTVVRNVNEYYQAAIIDADISTGTPVTSTVVELGGKSALSVVIASTLTLSGDWLVYVSNNYDRSNPGGARWSLLTNTTINTWLATTFASYGGKPYGTAGDGNMAVWLPFQAVKFVFTRSAGSGHLYLDAHAVA